MTGVLHEIQYTVIVIYISQFFLEWEMFATKVVEKMETNFLF